LRGTVTTAPESKRVAGAIQCCCAFIDIHQIVEQRIIPRGLGKIEHLRLGAAQTATDALALPVHHGDAMRQARGFGQVMGDEHPAKAAPLRQ